MITRIKAKQPSTKKFVLELAVGGWLGKKFRAANWGGSTIPLPFMVVILYWVTPEKPMPDKWVREHEFIHVRQDQGNLCFLVSWAKYLWEFWANVHPKTDLLHPTRIYPALMASYLMNKYEVEAYKIEMESVNSGVYPDWLND